MNTYQQELWPGWKTVDKIGEGSFGYVYKIQRDVLGETEVAALKMISIPQNSSDIDEMISEGLDAESITSTFQSHLRSIVAEYSLMHKMKGSANVVSCDDVRYVQHEDGVGWDIFIKMELLTPLMKALPQTFSEELVINLGKDMCAALLLCQKHGVIHRDIKPQNIFASEHGDYKLGDFGVAKVVEKTIGGTRIGTYKYMAPEVYHNEPYNNSVDIYSLGLVLYWIMNERRLPFWPLPPAKLDADIDKKARDRRFSGEKIPAPAHGSEELKQIVLKACAYDPKDRYQSAQEMLQDLENVSRKKVKTSKQKNTRNTKNRNTGKKKHSKILPVIGGIAAVAIAATLIIGAVNSKLEIVSQPWQSSVSVGEKLYVYLSAEGKDLQYTWMMAQPGSDVFEKVGTNSPTFSQLADIAMNDSRLYCVITDRKGNQVESDTLTIKVDAPIKITSQPVDATADIGQKVTVSVTAEGDELQYQWWFADGGQTEFKKSAVLESVYSIEMNNERNGRQLYCEITDANGFSIVTDTVTIGMNHSVAIITQPKSAEVGLNKKVSISVEALGENLKYEWYYKDVKSDKFVKTDSFKDKEYSVQMQPDRDGRQLYCVITAPDGSSVQTDTVTITMKKIQITTQPKSVTVAKGEKAVVKVEAKGEKLTYCWWFAEKNEDKFRKSTITDSTYSVSMDETRDGRKLYCEITDAYGLSVTTETIEITMEAPIVITKQPKNLELKKGEKGTIQIAAKGKDLKYEWYYKNPNDPEFSKTDSFSGNTYTIEMDDKRNGRQVYCVITDAEGNRVQTDTVTIKMK